MADYIRWSLRQIYLYIFWPTRFWRDFADDWQEGTKTSRIKRLHCMLKMLPWMIALVLTLSLIIGVAYKVFGLSFDFRRYWVGITVGVVTGVTLGTIVGAVSGISTCVGNSILLGVLYGLNINATDTVVVGLTISVTAGIAIGIANNSINGVGRVLTVGGLVGLLTSVGTGIVYGGAMGAILALPFPLAFWSTYFRFVTYPLDFILAALAYRHAKENLQISFGVWRWCPVAWNELIWLPLPFVSKLLVLMANQAREEALKQISFVAAERPLQKRAAIKALSEIAINDLQAKSLADVANVTEKLVWATAAPADLPNELATFLPRFAQVSQHTGQYLELHNAFRKGQALEAAVESAASLLMSLMVSRGNNELRLMRVAYSWSDLLQIELETFRARTKAERTIPNPFVFGMPVNETPNNVFTGRRDIAEQIEESLLGASHTPMLLLHGPRRMGKTSILKQLPRMLGPDFAPALLDLEMKAPREDVSSLLLYFSRAVSEGLRRRHVFVEPLVDRRMARGPFRAFDGWLDGVEREMPPRMRALLCLDEYESLQSALAAGWGGDFLDTMRNLLQHRQRLTLMFTGAHTFAEMGHEWTSRFISARRVRVGFLTREELIPLLTEPIPEFDMRYADDGAMERIITTTNGQPFLTQAIAFELVQFLNSEKRKVATLADAEIAITRALESGGEYFANVWSDTGEGGRAILLAIVRGETPPDLPTAEDRLRNQDLLNGDGQFAVPMIERWVREKASKLFSRAM